MAIKKIKLTGFKISVIITFAFLSLFAVNNLVPNTQSFLNLVDKKLVDLIIRSRSGRSFQTEVAIVAVDTKSIDKYGRWPWGRDIMSELLHELESYYRAKIVGFDIVFSETDPNDVIAENILQKMQRITERELKHSQEQTEQYRKIYSKIQSKINNDTLFGAELSKYDNVVLGYFFFSSRERIDHMTKEERQEAARRIENSEITIIQGAKYLKNALIFKMQAVESNIPELVSSANLSGFFTMVPDAEDGAVRRVQLVLQYGDKYYPSLDLQVLRLYYGNPSIHMVVNEGGIDGFYLGDKYIDTDSDGSIMINYRGSQFTFPHYSVYDVINRKVPREALRNKIVMIGATEVGIYDLRTTPVGADFPGIEVHANVIDNIIKDDYFYSSDLVDLFTFLLILVLGLTVGFALSRLSALPGLIFSLLLLAGYTSIDLWYLYNENTWTSFVYVIGVIVVNWFAVVIFKFFGEERDKRFIKGAFQRYLSPTVIDQLVANPRMLKLGGEKRELTAFFSDIQSFSTISESLTPEELVEVLNEYLTTMTDIILKHGGTVDKFEGDAIIAFFGAPVRQKDHALRCCLASIEMQERLLEMRKNWKEQGKPELLVRMGVNTGNMVVGNMGSAYRMDYTIMGDSVNLTARLEGANKEYQTFFIISEYTYRQVKQDIEARELDLIRVIGKNKPVRVYEVLGRKGDIPEERLKIFHNFALGLSLYRNRQWEKATQIFHRTTSALDGDGPSETFLKRCRYYTANPAAPGWDGVFAMTRK